MRGRIPVPTAMLEARGSDRARRRKREPKAKSGRPVMPSWLCPEAKKVWRQMVQLLEELRVLTTADKNSLARYCSTWARWIRACQYVDAHGEFYKGAVGGPCRHPNSILMDRLADQLVKLEREFGLTPASRPRLLASTDTSDDGEHDPLAELRE